MSDDTRPQYIALRSKLERPLDFLVILAAIGTIPLTVVQTRGIDEIWVTAADWLIWAVFLVEYWLMVTMMKDRWAYTRRNWLSVSVIILSFPALPHLLALVRLTRLVRLLRLIRVLLVTTRAIQAMRVSLAGQGLLYVATLTTILTLAGGGLLAVLELDGDFWTGVWWAVVTVTTVGYGDIAPATLGGRLLAVLLMLCGLGLLATLAASISSYFIGSSEEEHMQRITERLDRIERLLEKAVAERGDNSEGLVSEDPATRR